MNGFLRGFRKRRSGDDRRVEEKGPPSGWSERRRAVERRKPQVREISFSEWVASVRQKACETD